MKKALALFAVVLSIGMTAALDAEAKRLGGGKSGGMQRQNISAPAKPAGGAQGAPGQAAPAAGSPAVAGAPAAAAAAAPKRNWMGPVAGLAAGLGLAALASHFGFGEALANMMMIGLVVMAVLLLVGFMLRKRAAGQAGTLAGAGGPAYRGSEPRSLQQGGSLIGSRLGGGLGSPSAGGQPTGIPADFDTATFARNAEAQFVGLQTANDARDLNALRGYLTPEMFDLVRADIDARSDAPQKTEVFGLQAQVLDVAQEETHYVVSVRFTGSVRDQHGAVPEDLDEIWHLTKPRAGQGGWMIAGIQQGAESDGRPA
ncbi:Tim44 domain-containing protein [Caenimonas soli]|uniref:Tim44 domain-containing protein n=1 Tax=Caenimonas soli TaxID=2735555 RepID=UPI0015528080|nr:Tim44-like domain-containing protein [Caenimonas soli]NPC58727.1 Tim44 domain-containing protein [Caenimonas soli]